MRSAITSKGQVTIPKGVRQFMNVKAGDEVRFFTHPAGYVVMLPPANISAAPGLLNYKGAGKTIEEIAEGPALAVSETFRKFLKRK